MLHRLLCPVLLPLPGRAFKMALPFATDARGSIHAGQDARRGQRLAEALARPGVAEACLPPQAGLAQGIEMNAVTVDGWGLSLATSPLCRRLAMTRGGYVRTNRGFGDPPLTMRAAQLRHLTLPGH